jgi:hypothetical protein
MADAGRPAEVSIIASLLPDPGITVRGQGPSTVSLELLL